MKFYQAIFLLILFVLPSIVVSEFHHYVHGRSGPSTGKAKIKESKENDITVNNSKEDKENENNEENCEDQSMLSKIGRFFTDKCSNSTSSSSESDKETEE